ncbi:MAG TPA: gluconate:H+ symporter [Chryseosolibacter sp.]|nr:gluconate:H+ symporter [Chryseosolibacter sp.]
MSILIVFLCIAFLILLISYYRFNAFLAFLVVSVIAAILLGIPAVEISKSITRGIGDMLGSLVIVIACGAMLGKLVADSGAAQQISSGMMQLFGPRHIQWALMLTGFIIGIPLFYTVGFVLVVPLIFAVAYRHKLSAVYVGLPMLAALSVTHGFLPPHPSPAALVAQFNAHIGKTLLYGIIVAIPTVIIAGPLFAKTLRRIHAPMLPTFKSTAVEPEQLPSLTNSLLSSLFPVILLSVVTLLVPHLERDSYAAKALILIGDPSLVMLLSLLVATLTLGKMVGTSIKKVMDTYADAIKDVSILLLIISGSGALKQILTDSGVSVEIGFFLNQADIHPLVLGWIIACTIRVCVGSATVAGLTAAGIMIPLVGPSGVDPNLMVLAIGAGSLMFSHVNDAGFWLFKEYFNLSISDTIKSWSLMESIVSVCGLAGVMILEQFIQ